MMTSACAAIGKLKRNYENPHNTATDKHKNAHRNRREMGRLFVRKVPGELSDVYCCLDCGTGVASAEQIVSRAFHGKGGRAYLISGVINVYTGDRSLLGYVMQ